MFFMRYRSLLLSGLFFSLISWPLVAQADNASDKKLIITAYKNICKQNNEVLNIQFTKQRITQRITDSQAKSLLVGTWKATSFEHGQRVEIFLIIKPNGILYFSFKQPNGNILTKITSWKYSGNIFTEVGTDGEISKGSIEFINSNYFVLTILTNADPTSAGFKRHYYRDSP